MGGALLAAIGGSMLLSACGGGDSGGSNLVRNSGACEAFDCKALVVNVADNVVTPAMKDFESKAANLDSAVAAWRADQANAGLKSDAQEAWNQVMLAWQAVEVMQTGPLVDNSGVLRDSIYSWPSTSTCAVDQEVIEAEKQGANYDIRERTPLRKGLAALEYILYTDTLNHTCPASTDSTAGWNDRGESERLSARLGYAEAASGRIKSRAEEVITKWASGADNFRDELVNAGTGDSRFGSNQEAVNALSDALFYIEKQVKDVKLAEPLDLKGNKCDQGAPACGALVENPFSERSKEHIRQNIETFQQMFLGNAADGTEGMGFDDLIDSVSDGENVSAAMEADINEALDALDALDLMSLKEAVTDSNGVNLAVGVHESTKKITDRLKNDFLAVLGLTIPAAAAGDGD
jgi:predicted lipoprotein